MSLDIEALYRHHRRELIDRVYRIVRCSETARDLTQESYLILSREAAVATVMHPRGFLHRVALNLAFDHLKRRKVEAAHRQRESSLPIPITASAETLAARTQCVERFQCVINELPFRCREAFVLHKLYGLSYREVAQRLGISESAVEKHIMRGLLHCRRRLCVSKRL